MKENIPEGWEKIKLKEVLTEVSERNKGEKVQRVLSVTNSKGFVNQEEYFEGTVHSSNISNYKIIRKNQFAYNPSRVNVGSIDILKDYEEGALSPMYIIFKVDETRVLPEYFKYYFQTHRFFENVKNNTQGSVRNSLSFRALANFEYVLPPIEEQKIIIKSIEEVSKIIEDLEVNMILCIKIKKYLIENFTNNVNVEYKNLNELVEFQNGINASADKYGTGIKHISVMDILNNKVIKYNNIKGKVDVDDNVKERYKVTYGDILFVRSSENLEDAGKSNVYMDKDKEAVFGGFVIRGKKKVNYDPLYINEILKSSYVRKQIMKYAAGTQHVNISQESLKKVKIPLCSINQQERIGNIFKIINKKVELLNKKKNYYNFLQKGLMQQLLTGKVRIKV